MERLSGLDAAFIYVESPTTHVHVAATCVFDLAGGPVGPWFEAVRLVVEERLGQVPILRQRLVEVPGRLDYPRWVEEPSFDPDHHLHRVTLAAPGGSTELAQLAGAVMAQPLDRARPLWEMHLVDGLEGGKGAVVIKVHHAAADGLTAISLLGALLDPEDWPGANGERPETTGPPAPVRSGSEMVADALLDLGDQALAVAGALWRTAEVAAEVKRRNRTVGAEPPPPFFRAPRTCLNATIGPHRRVAFTEVGLDEVKAVKAVARVTTNDVVLAVCSEALRRHLAAKGEELAESLVALVPISARRPGRSGANQVSGMLVSLATDVADPMRRLRTIAANTRQARHQERTLGADVLADVVSLAAPLLAVGATRLISRLRLFDRLRPPCNVIVSNLSGLASPLRLAGADLEAIYPMAPVTDGVALNITVVRYVERLFFGLVGCRDTVPDVEVIAHHVGDALAELVSAAVRP